VSGRRGRVGSIRHHRTRDEEAGQRAEADPLRDEAAALRKKLRALEGWLEKNREK
jgi:hypothetical protein